MSRLAYTENNVAAGSKADLTATRTAGLAPDLQPTAAGA
jgi:hypothetical protein